MSDKQTTFLGFIKQNRYLLLTILFVIMITYGYSLITADDLSIDEESLLRSSTVAKALAPATFGRYGISVFNITFLPKFDNLPFFNLFIALGLMALSALLLCYVVSRILKTVKIPTLAYMFLAAVMICFPGNVDMLSFNSINIQIALATNFSLFGLYLITRWVFEKKGLGLAVVGVILSWFAIAVYQSFTGVYISFAVIFTFLYLLNDAFAGKKLVFGEIGAILVKHIAVFIITMTVYYTVNYVVKVTAGLLSNGYTESLIEMNSFRQILYNVYYNFKINFFSDRIPGAGNIKYLVLVFLLSQISLCFYPGVKNKGWIVILAVLLIFSPFPLTAIRAGIMLRSLTAFPVMLGFCGFFTIAAVSLWMENIAGEKIKKAVMATLIVLTVWVNYSYIYNVNLSSYASHVRYIRDENLARMIGDDIIDETGDDAPGKPIILIGKYPIKEMENGLTQGFGGSQFNYDVEYFRGIYLMNYIGYKFTAPTQAEYDANKSKAEGMTDWPAAGSIVEYDDAIIVKLSDITE